MYVLPMYLVNKIRIDSNKKRRSTNGYDNENNPVYMDILFVWSVVGVDDLNRREDDAKRPTKYQHHADVTLNE